MPQATRIPSLLLVLFFFSCANKKNIIYFQGDKDIRSDIANNFASVLKTDDLLSITVMGADAEAVKPFNLSTYGQYTGKQTELTVLSGSTGYLIDANGEIEFPNIGKIKLAGLTRPEAAELIKTKLSVYLKQAMVNIQVLNYKITILGDVSKPGTYSVPYERLTILEAIGMAGDLNLTGMRKNVLVIRDRDGKKTETRVDLTTKEVFNSPVFYLQQNDVVYVEPNRPRKNSSVVNSSGITIAISIATLLITITTLLITK